MNGGKFSKFFNAGKEHGREMFVALCMTAHLYTALMLSEKFTFRFIGVTGPSMVPTLDSRDNLVMLDCFTIQFIRHPAKGDVIMAQNPFKPGYTVIKRVLFTEGELARHWSEKHKDYIEVEVPQGLPQGHVWVERSGGRRVWGSKAQVVEGDNKENSND